MDNQKKDDIILKTKKIIEELSLIKKNDKGYYSNYMKLDYVIFKYKEAIHLIENTKD